MADGEDAKWEAVQSGDKRCDGAFYYGVKTTGVFCRPSCRARIPRRENVVFFDSAGEAMGAGYRPCKICRPDQLQFDPDSELAARADACLRENYLQADAVFRTASALGVSENHLTRVYKKANGVTPAQRAADLRIEYAKDLLRSSDQSVMQIALSSGFESLSNFYRRFKEWTGVSPAAYRALAEAETAQSPGKEWS